MPLYNWCCRRCEREVEVVRSFKEYEEPPTKQEADDAIGTCEYSSEIDGLHDFERKIGGKVTWIKGGGYWADK